MDSRTTEKGQTLVLIALAAVGIFAFAALAIDGSRAYSDKRHAQNAADTAALAGALAYSQWDDITITAQNRATSNGYDGGDKSDVTVDIKDIPGGSIGCPGNAAGKEITVTIVSYLDTTFARVIGRGQVINAVTATSRGCGYTVAPLFGGHAIVGLKPTNSEPCAFDSGDSNSAKWKIEGSGLFSNSCALAKNTSSVTLDPGECMTAYGTASGFSCIQQSASQYSWPDSVWAIMPPNPCDGTPGDIGLPPPASGSTFKNGVYCISNLDNYDSKDIVLENATLYVTDLDFDLKFAGGGGFSGTATQEGDFKNYYMVVAFNPTKPCPDFTSNNTQVIEWRGNGGGSFYGTLLAPSACVDVRGNGDPAGMNTQIVGYIVGSNGNAEVYINYEAEDNHLTPIEPNITLLK